MWQTQRFLWQFGRCYHRRPRRHLCLVFHELCHLRGSCFYRMEGVKQVECCSTIECCLTQPDSHPKCTVHTGQKRSGQAINLILSRVGLGINVSSCCSDPAQVKSGAFLATFRFLAFPPVVMSALLHCPRDPSVWYSPTKFIVFPTPC